jgi:deoxyribodipyrimidine photo-lyase
MIAVRETGYLNFRMRAVLVSFLCHQLWQDWQSGAAFLAKQFLDYIPGIHYPQFQMQNGSTGINTIRIYNPVKQSLEKDPEALFIDDWLPALRDLPLAFKHQPWLMTEMERSFYNFELGRDYPKRIIDINQSGAKARDILWAFRKTAAVRRENQRILIRHTTAIRDPQMRSKKIIQPENGKR